METLGVILFLVGCIGTVISIILVIKDNIKKQKNKKNKKMMIGFICLIIISLIVIISSGDKKNVQANGSVKTEGKKNDLTIKDKDKSNKVKGKVEDITRKNVIGKSNKIFKELSDQKPREVRNDITGNWRLTTISSNVDIKDYALSYYNQNFGNNAEIHAVVNFATNTTTKISDMGNFIEVVVLQYVEKEEHDAKKLFGGMKLAHYWIYKDNGEIEKIK
ncbi:hypothetical protein [Clostridium botulinum]|uniref:Uncharacterized protein n=1 Tax=Clostridium botulinum TaxID=1491 RepID=A0A9Q1ZAY1_CLOBO|nr:hypothetical protein [Clostridium botulinum]AEB76074.1 hypothetical protein CbC4_1395 [Clostridium botulinum BKT015925]KEI02401.1 hypothetical protein Z953_07175 [Clostridium botulinum D str. 16868]KEI04129.1 hypothetical protein Y848_03040 [Clostridium botulinum C/D str. Sp77]KLU76961.1 hypothetical protein CBC3_00945 [Clostridium botulinum V891]KOA76318.1 hypothetical protein ADU77_09210 [Clostridium botulinum]